MIRPSLYAGDLTTAPAEAICTSTNPRLSLMMGTGAAVREAGGWDILRACEEIVDEEIVRSGKRHLKTASAHRTTAGSLPFKGVIHCVACNEAHLSSATIVKACVINALAVAARAGYETLAMPVFGSGHARVPFATALTAMATALRDTETTVRGVVIVVFEPERLAEARGIVDAVFTG